MVRAHDKEVREGWLPLLAQSGEGSLGAAMIRLAKLAAAAHEAQAQAGPESRAKREAKVRIEAAGDSFREEVAR